MNFSPSVIITDEAMDIMLTAGLAELPYETGGILAGFRTEDQVVVTRAAIVPDVGSSRHDYQLQKQSATEELARLKVGTSAVVGFVGDWHTHPADVPPSSIDVTSLEFVARSAGDLVALVVLPFHQGEPRPVHVRVGRQLGSARLNRRARVTIHHAPLTITSVKAEDLERSAESALKSKETPAT